MDKDIIKWLEVNEINDYSIKNNEITVNNNVYIKNMLNFDYFPIKFKKINGSFYVTATSNINTFKNCPDIIFGNCYISENFLIEKFDYFPMEIHEGISVTWNKLENVEIFEKSVIYGDINLNNNQINSLKGLPENIYGDLNISNNKITTLDYLPKTYNNLYIHNNLIPLEEYEKFNNEFFNLLNEFNIVTDFNIDEEYNVDETIINKVRTLKEYNQFTQMNCDKNNYINKKNNKKL